MSGRPPADAIVVAAGASRRMGGVDKLDHPIAGRPLLAWTLARIAAAPVVEAIVVVAAEERLETIMTATWLPASVVAVVAGGARRQESVAAGLRALDDRAPDPVGDRVVLVHDGARPLVPTDLVADVAAAAARHGAAIPVLPVADTLKRLDGDRVAETVDRTDLAAAQTPQGARRRLLRDAFVAHPADGARAWTDEAGLLEACRIPVHAIPGSPDNLKVTVPADLATVEAALAGPAIRHGLGHDSHPFGPGGPLRLGAVAIDGAPRLAGHSDGDVALHAIADALLGAIAGGDLGRLFPAGTATPRGVASDELLRDVVGRLAADGWRPAAVDLTILGARPRLAGRLDEMRDRIAALLDLPVGRVSVKASTGNLAGMEGAGRGISAQAIATVDRIR